MRTIAITGGKGGTGKSTVSVLLANKFRRSGKKVILCDCDVECPNDHLLLGKELGKPVEKVRAKFPKLDKEKCTKCGLCVKNCRSNAVFMPKREYPIFIHELCSGCGLCWNLCPQGAIEIEKKVTGEVFINKVPSRETAAGETRPRETSEVKSAKTSEVEELAGLGNQQYGEGEGWLITGRSVGVVEETGPIVTETRKFAEELGEKVGADYLLLDTSVGMHCGVIRALIGVDEAYAVTEPTPLGAHDLRLILELLKKLEVPSKIVLNQADLGDRKEIDEISKDFGVRIEFEIPYSKELVEAYSKGKLGVTDFSLLQ